MVSLFLSLSNDDGDGNENGKKKQLAYISKTTTLHVHHASCTFLCRRCTTTTLKCLISRFVEDVDTRQGATFFFLA